MKIRIGGKAESRRAAAARTRWNRSISETWAAKDRHLPPGYRDTDGRVVERGTGWTDEEWLTHIAERRAGRD